MLKHVNVKELEARFIKLQAELIILRCKFYKEATASLKEATQEFESWRCQDGGLTEQACWMLGLTKRLEDTLHNKGISEFMDYFDSLEYGEWVQFDHQWWSLGLSIESVEGQLKELHKQLVIAKQNNQLEQAFKAVGF